MEKDVFSFLVVSRTFLGFAIFLCHLERRKSELKHCEICLACWNIFQLLKRQRRLSSLSPGNFTANDFVISPNIELCWAGDRNIDVYGKVLQYSLTFYVWHCKEVYLQEKFIVMLIRHLMFIFFSIQKCRIMWNSIYVHLSRK